MHSQRHNARARACAHKLHAHTRTRGRSRSGYALKLYIHTKAHRLLQLSHIILTSLRWHVSFHHATTPSQTKTYVFIS